MNQPPHVLYVAWQDPDSRRILPVARVITSGRYGYEFAYIQAVDEAREHGFLPLLTFPDLQKVYRSRELMPLLQNRLLQNSRPDFPYGSRGVEPRRRRGRRPQPRGDRAGGGGSGKAGGPERAREHQH